MRLSCMHCMMQLQQACISKYFTNNNPVPFYNDEIHSFECIQILFILPPTCTAFRARLIEMVPDVCAEQSSLNSIPRPDGRRRPLLYTNRIKNIVQRDAFINLNSVQMDRIGKLLPKTMDCWSCNRAPLVLLMLAGMFLLQLPQLQAPAAASAAGSGRHGCCNN